MSKEYFEYLLNEMAELEHEQWAHWIKYMLNNLTSENITRWKRQIEIPYGDLSEKEKNSDREWAIKSINIAKKYLIFK